MDDIEHMKIHKRIYNKLVYYATELKLPVIPLCSHDHEGFSPRHESSCNSPGKAPCIKNWQNATVPLIEEISEWKAKFPLANVGLVLGQASGIIAIDVDGNKGKEFLKELSNGDIPLTLKFTTPNHGVRYLYRIKQGISAKKYSMNSDGKGHQGVELLGDGCQTVMPCSIHQNGGIYKWCKGKSPKDREMAYAPEWMLKLMSAPTTNSIVKESEQSEESELQSLSQSQLAIDILKSKCKIFNRDLQTQINSGLDEDLWFIWESLMVNSGNTDAAIVFSEASEKHNERSIRRIEKLDSEFKANGCKGMTRCETFGCTKPEIIACFNDKLHFDDRERIKNSPGAFLKGKQFDKEKELIIARETIENMFTAIRKGDKGAHMEEAALKAASVIAENDKPYFARITCGLKELNVPVRDFNTSVKKHLRQVVGGQELSSPIEPIYKDWATGVIENNDYFIDENGRFFNFDKDNRPHILCNFVARIAEEINLDDGLNEPEKKFLIEGILTGGKALQNITITAMSFQNMSWVINNWGHDAIIKPYVAWDEMRNAIQEYSTKADVITTYTHMGWRLINGKYRYLHAGGCIGDKSVRVAIDDGLSSFKLPPKKNDLVDCVNASLSVMEIAPHEITFPFFAVTYLAPMCEVLRILKIEPKFVAYIVGSTGNFKTSMLMLFQSHFGEFASPPASFKDTKASVEKKTFLCKDVILIIDDYHPTKSPSEASQMQALAQNIMRTVGDRIGKGRSNSALGLQKTYPPRGMVCISGEDFIDGESSLARGIGVDIKAGDIDVAKLTVCQKNTSKLAYSMRKFIIWLGEKYMNSDPEKIKVLFLKYREKAKEAGQHARLAETVAFLYLGLYFFFEFAIDRKVLSQSKVNSMLLEGWDIFIKLAELQSNKIKDQDPVNAFLNSLNEMLRSGVVHVLSKRNAATTLERPSGAFIGWYDEKFYYLFPVATFSSVSAFVAKRHERISVSDTTLWKQMRDRNIIKTEDSKNDKHLLPKVTINNKRFRVLHLYRNNIDDDLLKNLKKDKEELQDLSELE